MNTPRMASRIFGSLLALLAASPQASHACAVCFGRSDSDLARGMNMGILTLLVIITSVLTGIAGVGFYFAKRSSRLAASVASEGLPQTPTKV